MKKIALVLVCLIMILSLAGCATVNSDNSFQSQAPSGAGAALTVETQQETQQDAQPTAAPTDTPKPTQDPSSVGING